MMFMIIMIIIMVIIMIIIFITMKESGRELARQKQIVKMLTEKWMRDRRITVRQVRELADEIQWHEDNSRIATLAGTSAGIVGGGLAIAGGVSAFFTFGASLALTVVGGAISSVGGATLRRHRNYK